MTEQIKVEGDTLTYNGVKYQKVEEPEPQTFRGNIEYVLDVNELEWDAIREIAKWLDENAIQGCSTRLEQEADKYD